MLPNIAENYTTAIDHVDQDMIRSQFNKTTILTSPKYRKKGDASLIVSSMNSHRKIRKSFYKKNRSISNSSNHKLLNTTVSETGVFKHKGICLHNIALNTILNYHIRS